jgi:hypothetical protein
MGAICGLRQILERMQNVKSETYSAEKFSCPKGERGSRTRKLKLIISATYGMNLEIYFSAQRLPAPFCERREITEQSFLEKEL